MMFYKIVLVCNVAIYIFSVAAGVAFALCGDYFAVVKWLTFAIIASVFAGDALRVIRIERWLNDRIERWPNEKH